MKCNSSNRLSPFTEFRALLNTDYHSFNIQSCQSNLRIIFNAKLIAVKGLVFGNWKFCFLEKKKNIARKQFLILSFVEHELLTLRARTINILSKLLFILSEEFFEFFNVSTYSLSIFFFIIDINL